MNFREGCGYRQGNYCHNLGTKSELSGIKENWIWAGELDIIVHVTDWEREFYQERRSGFGWELSEKYLWSFVMEISNRSIVVEKWILILRGCDRWCIDGKLLLCANNRSRSSGVRCIYPEISFVPIPICCVGKQLWKALDFFI